MALKKIGDDPKRAHALTIIERGIDEHSPISLVTQSTISSSHTLFPPNYLSLKPVNCLLHSFQGQIPCPPRLLHLLLDLPASQPFQ